MGSGCSSYDRVGGGQMTDEARRGLEVEAEMVQARLRDLFKFKVPFDLSCYISATHWRDVLGVLVLLLAAASPVVLREVGVCSRYCC